MADIMIVPVNADNAADFGNVIYRSWGETYRGLMPDEILDGRSEARWTDRARQSPDNKLIAYVDGEAAGAIGTLPQARDFCTYGDSFEIVALYVLKRFQRMGVGSTLICEALKDCDSSRVTLFVLKGNENAIAFYKKQGFDFTGKSLEDNGLTELEMIKNIPQ